MTGKEATELIVEFHRGVAEEDARQVISAAGATVRRKMRTDHADQVMLLVKVEGAAIAGIRAELDRHPKVTRTEPNPKAFHLEEES